MTKKPVAAVVAVAALATGMVGGWQGVKHEPVSKAPHVTLTFSWWGGTQRNDAMLKTIAEFEKLHPNVTVEPEYGGSKGYKTKLYAELAANDAPDVFTNGTSGWDISPSYRKPLNGLGVNIAHIDPELIQAATVDGKLQGIPNHIAYQAVLYNKTLLAKLGISVPGPTWTWAQFATVMGEVYHRSHEKITGAVDVAAGFGPVNQAFEQYIQSQSNQVLVNTKGLGVTKPVLTRALTYWQNLANEGYVTSGETTATLNTAQGEAVVNGVAAFDFVQPSTLSAFQAYTSDQLGLLPMPNGPYPAEWKKLGTIYSIAANAPQPRVAAEFINFLTNNPTAIRTMNDLVGVPASTVAQTIVDKTANLPAVDREQQAFVEYVEKHVPTVLAPNQPLATSSFFKTLDQVEQELAFHKVTVSQAVADIEAQSRSIF